MPLLHPPASFFQGDTWEIEGKLFYADGSPFNLNSGAAVVWDLKDFEGNATLSLSLTSGIVVENPLGIIMITVTPEQSAAIAKGEYADQLRATDPEGFVSTQWTGVISVRQSAFV